MASLLKAIEVIAEMYRSGKRSLPEMRRRPSSASPGGHLYSMASTIDRKAYVLCALSELRDRLRAGDVWVDGSRQYQDFENYLLPKATYTLLKAEGPLPLAIETDSERYLAGRCDALARELSVVSKLAEAGKLQDVEIADGDIKITPLRAVTPPEAAALKDAAYDLLPRVKITDLLQEVDRWTGFCECFTHRRSGRPAEDKSALLSAILADGINLGLTRMADVCRGVTLRQLAWVHDWHVREETYGAALARLIEAHRVMPLAAGSGVTARHRHRTDNISARGSRRRARPTSMPAWQRAGRRVLHPHLGPIWAVLHQGDRGDCRARRRMCSTACCITRPACRSRSTTPTRVAHRPRVRPVPLLRLPLRPAHPRPQGPSSPRVPGQAAAARLQPIMPAPINIEHVKAHWEELLRLAHLDPFRHRHRFGDAETPVRLSATEWTRRCAARDRPPRTLDLHDGLAEDPELRRRAQAGLNKGEARNALARAHLLSTSLGELRDRQLREPVLSGIRPQPAGRRHHPVEHEISGSALGCHRDPQHLDPARDAARLGAYQPDRRL